MSHCARTFHGAWWFTACHESHLNGRYHRYPHRISGDGINWMTFKGLGYSHKFTLMMVRPASYSVGRGAPDGRVAGDSRSTLYAPPTVLTRVFISQ
ncbi:hypothetical protein HAZT_HAZT010127 [Hyalella azteca]|uniref:Fibrinogen C-terminal domain-containing protein n=1 Tax=Hyalella azteca TaxID=294128 RepID=A0A6A0GSB8_HYAAZ|nr:hypothetical protein HAZT_HAZT010127 [Hyalella azteca]